MDAEDSHGTRGITRRPRGCGLPVSWAPEALAGNDRADAIDLPDKGPVLYLNVGSSAYASLAEIDDTAPATAPITKESGSLRLEFLLDGRILVRAGGRGVDRVVLRRFTTSLRPYERADWRERLRDRLLVDEPAA